MAARGESAASGASAVSSAASALDRGSASALRDRRVERMRHRLSVAREQACDEPFAVDDGAARQVDDDLQPFVESATRLGPAAEGFDEPRRIKRQHADSPGADRALRRIDPGDRRPPGAERRDCR